MYFSSGKEFLNKKVGDYLLDNFVIQMHSKSDKKAGIAENYLKQIKDRIYKHLTKSRSNNYIKVLPKIISGLNRSVTRKHGMAPVEVTKENQFDVWKKVYGKELDVFKKPKFKYNIGDAVQIRKYK